MGDLSLHVIVQDLGSGRHPGLYDTYGLGCGLVQDHVNYSPRLSRFGFTEWETWRGRPHPLQVHLPWSLPDPRSCTSTRPMPHSYVRKPLDL